MEIAYTSAAVRQMKKLSATVRRQIQVRLAVYAETGRGDVKALQGVDGFRLRSGDYRVIFTREAEEIVVRAVGHRRDIYD